jgi:predicted nucleotidyltransferase
MISRADLILLLRRHAPELQQAGVRHLSLFGSVARNEATESSDIDLAAEFAPEIRLDLWQLSAVQRQLSAVVGQTVDLVPEPVTRPALRQAIERDRVFVF